MNALKNIAQLNFEKLNGLIPAVIQDAKTLKVLMVGFMNEEALKITIDQGTVTFFSRTKNRLWTKGEDSGNYFKVESILVDCDADTLLIKVDPKGDLCEQGKDTCFSEENKQDDVQFLGYLQNFIDKRKEEMPEGSYTTSLFEKGTRKIAQKVGEEAVEAIIGAMAEDDENFIYESGDLIYHLIVLLSHKGYGIQDIVAELKKRHS